MLNAIILARFRARWISVPCLMNATPHLAFFAQTYVPCLVKFVVSCRATMQMVSEAAACYLMFGMMIPFCNHPRSSP